ncbi:hypothetical protein CRUP_017913 [Coryphaenoides rupestris]|nr:hypothetical protein CRUP_017913 [Coryphaenoides rupestris]
MLRRGVIAQNLCKNITLYFNQAGLSPASSNTQTPADPLHTKPLLLMLPWLGSQPQAMAKYCETYFHLGFDVLMVQSNITDFLWPRWGLEKGERILELLHSERFVSRPLLVHAFSIGCYTFCQMLVHVSRDPEKYRAFTSRIKDCVIKESNRLLPRSLKSMKPAKRPFRNKDEDRFDSMVEKYKNKIMGDGKKPASIKRNKWFS